jgi:hypothetical protein
MTDYFSQEAGIELPQPADAWRVAEDIRSLLESVFGDNWNNIILEFTATSVSNIRFEHIDLISLHEAVAAFGGPMRDISISASLFGNNELRSCDATLWMDDKRVQRMILHWYMPLRVDAESFRYGVERVVRSFNRRKRWANAKVKIGNIRHDSEASSPPQAVGPGLIRVNGIKWGLRRWFVQNRDGIIIGLLGSFLVSVGIIVLQLVGLVPVPT